MCGRSERGRVPSPPTSPRPRVAESGRRLAWAARGRRGLDLLVRALEGPRPSPRSAPAPCGPPAAASHARAAPGGALHAPQRARLQPSAAGPRPGVAEPQPRESRGRKKALFLFVTSKEAGAVPKLCLRVVARFVAVGEPWVRRPVRLACGSRAGRRRLHEWPLVQPPRPRGSCPASRSPVTVTQPRGSVAAGHPPSPAWRDRLPFRADLRRSLAGPFSSGLVLVGVGVGSPPSPLKTSSADQAPAVASLILLGPCRPAAPDAGHWLLLRLRLRGPFPARRLRCPLRPAAGVVSPELHAPCLSAALPAGPRLCGR